MGIISYVGSFFSSPPPNQKFADRYVLITGCDSGIGNLIAKALHRRGYSVLAGCLTEAAFKEFLEFNEQHSTTNLRPFLVDVTKDASVQQCARMVVNETKDKGLFALINNAGCNEGFAFEFTSNDQIAKTMEVNFIGPIKIIKALLPSLRQNIKYNLKKPAKDQDIFPRIINMTSILGRTTVPFLEDSRYYDRGGPLYGEDYVQKAIEFWQKLHSGQDNPKAIIRTIIEAIEVGFPRDRYVVGTLAKVHVLMNNVLPRWVIDLAWGSMIKLVGVWPKEVKELEDGVSETTSTSSNSSSSTPPSSPKD